MFNISNFIGAARVSALLALGVLAPPAALSQGVYDNGVIRGNYVLSFDGIFSSAPPPFSGPALPFEAAQVGRLTFDGAGMAWGEATLTFHHHEVPFSVVSRVALSGTYGVAPNGNITINLDEYPLDGNGEPASMRFASITYECYVLRRRLVARCVLNSLISYQQGPEPRNLPVTMSGSIERQR